LGREVAAIALAIEAAHRASAKKPKPNAIDDLVAQATMMLQDSADSQAAGVVATMKPLAALLNTLVTSSAVFQLGQWAGATISIRQATSAPKPQRKAPPHDRLDFA